MKQIILASLICLFLFSCSDDELSSEQTLFVEEMDASLPIISVGNLKVPENIGTHQLSIYLNKKATERIDFEYEMRPISATPNLDYVPGRSKRTIYPTWDGLDVDFTIKDDNEQEDLESFEIVIFDVVGATIGFSSGQVRIIDND